MPTNPRRNAANVLAGEAPGGVPQVVLTQLFVILTIICTYIGLWVVFDDSAQLPGIPMTEAAPIGLPVGVVHLIDPTTELTSTRTSEADKLAGKTGGMPIEQAMQQVVSQGLPVDKSAFEMPTKLPTESAPY